MTASLSKSVKPEVKPVIEVKKYANKILEVNALDNTGGTVWSMYVKPEGKNGLQLKGWLNHGGDYAH